MKPLLVYFSLFVLFGCTPPLSGEGTTLQVYLKMPSEHSHLSNEGAQVKMISSNGTVYSARTNTAGIASFQAEYGIYRISAQFIHANDEIEYLFNGGRENIRLTPKGSNVLDTLTIHLNSSKKSRLVIKEIYYTGCYDDNGKSYIKDSYVRLYNNSDSIVWLDSLCIGIIAPITAIKISSWLLQNQDSLPIAYVGWQFPGTGKDHPLLPGSTTTIAINAVNHTGSQYNHPNSVDLSQSEWAFYHSSFTQSDITTGVLPLNMFKRITTMTTYVLAIMGPSVAIYRIPNISAEAYAANPANIQKEPSMPKGLDYLMIHASWIIDCIDCVEDATKQNFKRMPSYVDAEATYLPSGKYSGRSLHRKMAETKNGRIIYQDNNNSFQDFEERIPTMKK